MGNIRVSYFKNANGSAEVLEENNFYPFGLKHEGYNAQPGNPSYNYEYSGKEFQKETGWSDFGARMYMADIGRWGVVDPLAETTTRVSPYNYALNNPVMFIDPDGRKVVSSEPMEAYYKQGGLADFFIRGGYSVYGSYSEFLGQDFFYQTAGGRGGSGTGSGAKAEREGSSTALVQRMAGLGEGTWTNTGYGFESNGHISLGYDGGYTSLNTELDGYINIPEVSLSGSSFFWGTQAQSGFNSYMGRWNTKSDFAWDRTSNAGRYADGGAMMIGGHGDILGLYDIGGQMMSTWKPENKYLAIGVGLAAIIFTKGKSADDAIKVFRAVDQAELASIKSTGNFLVSNGGTEAKYFANSLENAHKFGKQLYPNGYDVVEGIIYKSNNPMKYWSPNTDGIGAFIFNQKILKAVKPQIP